MPADIQDEVDRVVGGKSVRISDLHTAETANPRVKLETANATYNLPKNRLGLLLRELPDGIGVNALRQTLEEHFSKAADT